MAVWPLLADFGRQRMSIGGGLSFRLLAPAPGLQRRTQNPTTVKGTLKGLLD